MSLIDSAVLLHVPSAFKAGTLYNVLPNTATGDFDVVANGTRVRTNEDLYLEQMLAHVPRINYPSDGGCPHTLLEDEAENLLTTYKFSDAVYTKSGATIEGDASSSVATAWSSDFSVDEDGLVAGARLAATGNNDAVGTPSTDDVWKGVCTSDAGTHYARKNGIITSDKMYYVTFDYFMPTQSNADGFTWGATLTDNTIVSATLDSWTSSSGFTYGNSNDLFFYLTDGGSTSFTDAGGDDYLSLKNIVVTEVDPYEAPMVDTSDGTLQRKAYKLVEDGSSGTHTIVETSSVVTSTSVSSSVFVKANEVTKIRLSMSDAATGEASADFDLSTGTYDNIINGGSWTTTNTDITALANGWYKISVNSLRSGTGLVYHKLYMMDGDNTSYQGVVGNGLYIAFPQLEENDVASSYILTDGATASRVADDPLTISAANSTAYDFTTEDFSIRLKFNTNNLEDNGYLYNKGVISVNGISIKLIDDGSIKVFTSQSGANQSTISTTGSIINGVDYDVVIVRSGASVIIYIDGIDSNSNVGTHIDMATAISNNLYLGSYNNKVFPLKGKLNQFGIYDKALTPTEVASF